MSTPRPVNASQPEYLPEPWDRPGAESPTLAVARLLKDLAAAERDSPRAQQVWRLRSHRASRRDAEQVDRARGRLLSPVTDLAAELLAGQGRLPGFYHPDLRGRGPAAVDALARHLVDRRVHGTAEKVRALLDGAGLVPDTLATELDCRIADADKRAQGRLTRTDLGEVGLLPGRQFIVTLDGSQGRTYLKYRHDPSSYLVRKHVGHVWVEYALRGRGIGGLLLDAAVTHLGDGDWTPHPVKGEGVRLFAAAAKRWTAPSNRW